MIGTTQEEVLMNVQERSDKPGIGHCKIARQVDMRGWYAEVGLVCRGMELGPTTVTVSPAADFQADLSEWAEGAMAGAALGLDLAGTTAHCEITQLRGMVCDTDAVVVAIAAVRAVWQALGFQPPAEWSERIDSIMFRRYRIVAEMESVLRRELEAGPQD
jgi:hypothetical protein